MRDRSGSDQGISILNGFTSTLETRMNVRCNFKDVEVVKQQNIGIKTKKFKDCCLPSSIGVKQTSAGFVVGDAVMKTS